jgi:hypothetical protein
MKEINEAYDAIEKERASGGSAYQYRPIPERPRAGSTGSASALRDAREAINP